MVNQALRTVTFQGNSLYTVERDGIQCVAMKPICESIGLDWRAQRKRILRQPVLSSTVVMMTTVAEDGKNREMLMLPIKYLNGWLFGVDVDRVKLAIRPTLLSYQRECFDVLHDYWQNKTSGCPNDFQVFLEATRGKMALSPKGIPHNTVSPNTALVLRYLYHEYPHETWQTVSASQIGHDLKIDRTSVSRSIKRLDKWSFLTLKSGRRRITVRIHKARIDEVLAQYRMTLMGPQQNIGFLPAAPGNGVRQRRWVDDSHRARFLERMETVL